ncbi:unnamed protein product [Coregonus sp. 'balchen']|nr:unnamed protein product [Coregonus sp. 'balchen']
MTEYSGHSAFLFTLLFSEANSGCLAFWCFPCFACITAREAGECLCLPLLDGFGAIPAATMSMRVGMRQRYGIEGTMCNDCVYSFFCGPCTWCQMSREMKTRFQPITLINTHSSGRPVTMATSVTINNQQSQPPQPQTPAFIAVHSNQWSTGICGCFDDLQVCCFAYWCFPCFACTTTSEFGECFCLPLLDILWSSTQLVGVPTCIPPVSMSMRVAVRNRYGILMAREIRRRRQTFTVINAQPTMLPGQPMLMASQPGVINAQPTMLPGQPMLMASQPGVITSQPMITSAPQPILSTRFM